MISMIVAHDLARNIGFQGDMPWGRDMKGDLKRFKELTDGKNIVMGRRTFFSLPGVLPNRGHYILTRQDMYVKHPMARVVHDVEHILQLNKQYPNEEFVVIGGAQIYEQFMPHADRIYVTKIHELFEGDTKFPSITGKWNITYGPKLLVEGDKYPTEYITFERA